ncbi:MAG: glycoside hydrolase family 3 N-terminal domain-containing protein [Bacteroidota bacterium]
MMGRIYFILSLVILFTLESSAQDKKINATNISSKVNALISKMSIEEKVGQMTQLNLDVISKGEVYNLKEPHELDEAKLRKAIVEYKVGSILNCGGHTYTKEHWYEIIHRIQELATKETKLKIPILYGIDAIHGVNYTVGATLFPQPLAQAATWNPQLAEQAAAITAYEVRTSGIPWNFSPVLDIGRQPLWSRFFETYGEDVYLASQFTSSVIKGYQGNDISDKNKVAACMKHFLGYSYPISGKDRTPAWIPERELREYFLPTFKTAIENGAKTVMINSGEINGVPVHASKEILTKLLREELKFTGVAVTDWEDIIKLYKIHRVASSLKEAVKIAINAGIDLSMVPNDYEFSDLLIQLIKEKQVPMSRIDEAVKRILTLKFELGLFERPETNYKDYPEFGSDKSKEVSYNSAVESITLLKNEKNILPLTKEKKVLVCGPSANSLNILNGAWTHTWQGVDTNFNTKGKLTILQAVKNISGYDKVTYVLGSTLEEEKSIPSAVEAAKNCDVVIACLGEIPSTEKPGDIEDLSLSNAQIQMIKELVKTGKPVVIVLVENRPRIIREIADKVQGIVMAYLPGDEGGRAIASVLYGEENPSGKLPFTYPRHTGSLITYDHKYSEKLDKNFGENGYNPQFPFGFGLSYTSFEYSDLTFSKDSLSANEKLNVSVKIKNTGSRKGKEVVQMYVSDLYASITPSVKKLKGFQKIQLNAGEAKELSFVLSKKDYEFIGANNKSTFEPGDFEISIGNLKKKFKILK